MKLPNEGFRFNCGFDICEFPTQFCDEEEKRCGYCSDDICRSGSIPEQCSFQCSALSTTYTPANEASLHSLVDAPTQFPSIAGAYIIATFALVLVLIMFGMKIKKWYEKRRKQDYTPMVPKTIVVKQDAVRQPANEQGNENLITPGDTISQLSIPSATVVAQPDEETSSSSHNFGDHNILPSHEESSSLRFDELGSQIHQAQNDTTCEVPDHNILDGRSSCDVLRPHDNQTSNECADCSGSNKLNNVNDASSKNKSDTDTDTKRHFIERPNTQACTGRFEPNTPNSNVTKMKIRTAGNDSKVC